MIKILIYEDNLARQEALKFLIQDQSEMELTGIFENCSEVVSQVKMLSPDLVLMDIQMPKVNGIEGARLIHENFPGVTILMQTVFEDEDSIFNALQAGAHGYILKSTSPAKLIEAIRDSLEGGIPMTPVIARKVVEAFRHRPSQAPDEVSELTEKENRVLELLAKGMSYKMIAAEYGISWHTVNGHVKKIYGKLQVNSATEAVARLKERHFRNS